MDGDEDHFPAAVLAAEELRFSVLEEKLGGTAQHPHTHTHKSEQESANVSKYFRFTGHTVSVTTTCLCCGSMKRATGNV